MDIRELEEEDCKNCIYAQVLNYFNDDEPEIYCYCSQTALCKDEADINYESDSETEAARCPYYINVGYLYQPENIFEHQIICESCQTCTHNKVDCKQKAIKKDFDVAFAEKFYDWNFFKSSCPDYQTNQYQIDSDGNCIISLEIFKTFLLDHERLYNLYEFEKDSRQKFQRKAENLVKELQRQEKQRQEVLQFYNQIEILRKQMGDNKIALKRTETKLALKKKELKEIAEVNKDNEFLKFFKGELPDVYKSLMKEFKKRADKD